MLLLSERLPQSISVCEATDEPSRHMSAAAGLSCHNFGAATRLAKLRYGPQGIIVLPRGAGNQGHNHQSLHRGWGRGRRGEGGSGRKGLNLHTAAETGSIMNVTPTRRAGAGFEREKEQSSAPSLVCRLCRPCVRGKDRRGINTRRRRGGRRRPLPPLAAYEPPPLLAAGLTSSAAPLTDAQQQHRETAIKQQKRRRLLAVGAAAAEQRQAQEEQGPRPMMDAKDKTPLLSSCCWQPTTPTMIEGSSAAAPTPAPPRSSNTNHPAPAREEVVVQGGQRHQNSSPERHSYPHQMTRR